MNATVNYINSFDELLWVIDGTVHTVRCNIWWSSRNEVRGWLNQCCAGSVWIWNGISTLNNLRNDVSRPFDDARVYIMFEFEEDYEMFILKYTEQFDVIPIGTDLNRVYHDSKKQ